MMNTRRFSKAAMVAVVVVSATLLTGTSAGAARTKAKAKTSLLPAAAFDVKINGSPMCAAHHTASRVRLAIRPKGEVDRASVTVTGGPNVLTNVTGERNAWIAHLKGPRAYAAHTVTVTATVSGIPRSVAVALPTYVCGPPIPLDAALDGSPECVADDTATVVRLTLQPKADIDPTTIQVTGGPLVVSTITPGPDAWIVELSGPPVFTAFTATVTATVAGLPQTALVGIPAATCVHLEVGLTAGPECSVGGTGTHVQLALRPLAHIDPASITVTGPLGITAVTPSGDAFLVDLQGPAMIAAYTATVSADVGGAVQSVDVAIPAYWCIPLELALPGNPHCAGNGEATRVSIALRPKAFIDPTTVTVTGGPMVLTNVDGAPNAWVAHMKGPKALPAHTLTVSAEIAGFVQTAEIDIPAFTCTNHDPTVD